MATVATIGSAAACTSSKADLATVWATSTRNSTGPDLIRTTADQQRDGLSGRNELTAGTGMLFEFGSRGEQQVWMAGMNFPLDIAWIADGKIVAIGTLIACTEADENTCPRWISPSPVDALLEVPANSLTTVVPGTPIAIEERTT